MIRAALILFTIAFALWMTPPAQAQTMTSSGGSMYYGGALVGVGFISNNGGTQIDLGIQGGYKFFPSISAGLYATYNSLTAPLNASASLITLTPEINYHFGEGILSGARVGGKVGVAWSRSSVDTPGGAEESASDSSMGFVIGPAIGYDYALGGGLTAGAEANMLFYSQNDGFNAVNLLGNLKYWF